MFCNVSSRCKSALPCCTALSDSLPTPERIVYCIHQWTHHREQWKGSLLLWLWCNGCNMAHGNMRTWKNCMCGRPQTRPLSYAKRMQAALVRTGCLWANFQIEFTINLQTLGTASIRRHSFFNKRSLWFAANRFQFSHSVTVYGGVPLGKKVIVSLDNTDWMKYCRLTITATNGEAYVGVQFYPFRASRKGIPRRFSSLFYL